MIAAFLEQMSVGDTLKATGTFSQTNYVPHKTSYIDTTFRMLKFQKVHQNIGLLKMNGRIMEPAPGASVH